MPNPKANAPAAPNSLQRVVSFRMICSFASDPEAPAQQTAGKVERCITGTTCCRILTGRRKKAPIYKDFFNIDLTKSLAVFRPDAEWKLNIKNSAGMNCVNIVEAPRATRTDGARSPRTLTARQGIL